MKYHLPLAFAALGLTAMSSCSDMWALQTTADRPIEDAERLVRTQFADRPEPERVELDDGTVLLRLRIWQDKFPAGTHRLNIWLSPLGSGRTTVTTHSFRTSHGITTVNETTFDRQGDHTTAIRNALGETAFIPAKPLADPKAPSKLQLIWGVRATSPQVAALSLTLTSDHANSLFVIAEPGKGGTRLGVGYHVSDSAVLYHAVSACALVTTDDAVGVEGDQAYAGAEYQCIYLGLSFHFGIYGHVSGDSDDMPWLASYGVGLAW